MASPQPPYYFDASDDAAFQHLLDEHVVGVRNMLKAVKPSAINLTTNCWATLDLQHFTFNGSTTDDISMLRYINSSLRPALPYISTSAGLFDVYEYWSAVTLLNSTEAVVNAAIEQCNRADGFPIPALDFNANCSATADFWWHNVFNTTTPRHSIPDPSWLPLFRSSLPELYQNLSDLTITAIYEKARVDNLTLSNVLPGPLQTALVTAAASCAVPACATLDYSGDSDIAGTGAIIAYGFIAGVSTLLMMTLTYFRINDKNTNEKLRISLVEAALTFWDTVLWFGVLGCIAGLVYATTKAQSLYEFVISLLVVNLICNSIFLLCGLYSKKFEKMIKSVCTASRIIPQAFVAICMFVVVMEVPTGNSKYLWGGTFSWNHYNFVDMPCYAASVWPMHYLKIAVKLQGFLLLSPLLLSVLSGVLPLISVIPCLWNYFIFRKLVEYLLLLGFENTGVYILTLFSAAILWVDFGLIVYIRGRARIDFGATFADDGFGYGQIISAGIAVQVVYAYLYGVSRYLFESSKDGPTSTELVDDQQANGRTS